MKRFSYLERHKLFAGKTIISHNTSWGGAFADHKHWMAERDGEVWDYGSLQFLIDDAIKDGFDFVVLRVHRNGDATQLRLSKDD
jgi:hypothetical protein